MVTISNVKENVLEFDAEIKGVDTSDMSVHFVIQANGMDLGFDAKHLSGFKWEVSIPPLPMLERTAYTFRMNVDCDGYHFEPLTGTVNVVGSHDIYVSAPKQQTIPPKSVTLTPKPEARISVADQPGVTLESADKNVKQIGPRPSKIKTKIKPLGELFAPPTSTSDRPTRVNISNVDDLVSRVVKANNPITPTIVEAKKEVTKKEAIKPVKPKAQPATKVKPETDKAEVVEAVKTSEPIKVPDVVQAEPIAKPIDTGVIKKVPKSKSKTVAPKKKAKRAGADDAVKRILTKPAEAKKISKTISNTKLVEVVEATPITLPQMMKKAKVKPKINKPVDTTAKDIISEDHRTTLERNSVNTLKKVDDTTIVEQKLNTTIDDTVKRLLDTQDVESSEEPTNMNAIKKL